MVFTTSIKGNPTITVKFDPFLHHVKSTLATNVNTKLKLGNISKFHFVAELSPEGGEAVPG